MFNPIFKENVQGRKHPGSCVFPEPDLLSYRKCKHVVYKVKNGHKNPNSTHNYHNENHDEIEFYQGNGKRSTQCHSTPEQRTPTKISPIDCDGVQLTSAQYPVLPISIL